MKHYEHEYGPIAGRLGLREVSDAVVLRPDVQSLVKKVKVYPDPSIQVSTARVNIKVRLKNGKSYSEGYYPAKGATDTPLTREELLAKFHECAAWGGVSKADAENAAAILLDLERMTGPVELMKAVTRT